MRKQCPDCRSTSNAEAPYCDACGCDLRNAGPFKVHHTNWKGWIIAIVSGLLAQGLVHILVS